MISFLLTRNLTLRLHELLSDLIEIFYSVSALKKKKMHGMDNLCKLRDGCPQLWTGRSTYNEKLWNLGTEIK